MKGREPVVEARCLDQPQRRVSEKDERGQREMRAYRGN